MMSRMTAASAVARFLPRIVRWASTVVLFVENVSDGLAMSVSVGDAVRWCTERRTRSGLGGASGTGAASAVSCVR